MAKGKTGGKGSDFTKVKGQGGLNMTRRKPSDIGYKLQDRVVDLKKAEISGKQWIKDEESKRHPKPPGAAKGGGGAKRPADRRAAARKAWATRRAKDGK